MNKILILLINFMFLALFTASSQASVIYADFISSEVKKDLIKQVSSQIQGRIEVNVNQIPYKNLNIPEGKVEIKAEINIQNYFTSTTIAKVGVFVDNKEITSFGVPVKISVYDKVWVASEGINRGSSLTGMNIEIKEKEISEIAKTAARTKNSPDGYLAKKNFRIGEVIDTRYIETIPDIMRNNRVSIIFQSPYITVSMPGEAMQDGKIGDFIKVRNKQYKKDYIGKVVGNNTILVNI